MRVPGSRRGEDVEEISKPPCLNKASDGTQTTNSFTPTSFARQAAAEASRRLAAETAAAAQKEAEHAAWIARFVASPAFANIRTTPPEKLALVEVSEGEERFWNGCFVCSMLQSC